MFSSAGSFWGGAQEKGTDLLGQIFNTDVFHPRERNILSEHRLMLSIESTSISRIQLDETVIDSQIWSYTKRLANEVDQ